MIPPVATPPRTWSYRELRRTLSRSEIDAALRAGLLRRVRKGVYVVTALHPHLIEAARLHARLDCLSLLAFLGVFVLERTTLHVQVEKGTTATPRASDGVVRHWRVTDRPPYELTADIVGALAQAARCQDEIPFLATLDSALHLRLIDRDGLAALFARLPARFSALRRELDRQAESGPETVLRVALRRRGWRVEVQVRIDGVGRVDLLVEGWLIIECDSEAHHGGWAAQRRDRRRDQTAAALGYTTLRPIAEDILWHLDVALDAIAGLLAARAAAQVHNLSDPTSRVRL